MLDELVRRVVIMGLEVVDPVGYSLYCFRVRPVLVSHGGRVEYDLVVSEVIESPSDAVINRVVALSFPDGAAEAAFYDDDGYCLLQATLYRRAVASTTVIGAFYAPGQSS